MSDDGGMSDGSGHKEDEFLTEIEAAAPVGDARPAATRTTTKFMTKYERARVLGTRALQISMNAPVMVDTKGESDARTSKPFAYAPKKKFPTHSRRISSTPPPQYASLNKNFGNVKFQSSFVDTFLTTPTKTGR